MGAACCDTNTTTADIGPRYRKVLWIALLANAAMFGVEIVGGVRAGSVSLLADAVDFASDAANYGLSLAVLSLGLVWRARAAWVKGLSMLLYGLLVLAKTGWAAAVGATPEPMIMSTIAVLALIVNVAVAALLFAYREGDANQQSVWLCSRNDAIANVAVLLAAVGVFGTGTRWPDLGVALLIVALALYAGIGIMRRARAELRVTERQRGVVGCADS